MSEDQKIMNLEELEKAIIRKKGECTHCGRRIKEKSIRSYDHDGGMQVKGFKQKQWTYFHCWWCQIDSSIDKVWRKIKSKEKP